MNHLEQLVSEWLQYRGYYVKVSVPVGPRAKGGFEGELDVVAVNFKTMHLLHVECSLDSDNWEKRQHRFAGKFERGRAYIKHVFEGLTLPEHLDQVVLLHYASPSHSPRMIGSGRLVTVKEFVREMMDGLKGKSTASGAVPSTFPLLRTLQLVSEALPASDPNHRLIRSGLSQNGLPTLGSTLHARDQSTSLHALF
jgi:hypothetical protein